MKKVIEYTAVVLLSAAILSVPLAYAGTIKTWINSDTLYASDLNSNFNHIHNTMVGGHGARLVDADVNASAAISHSKMATPALLPKAWAWVSATCSSSPCTIGASSKIASITRASTGVYVVNFSYEAHDTSYGVWLTTENPSGNVTICSSEGRTTTSVNVFCDDDLDALTDTSFSILIMITKV